MCCVNSNKDKQKAWANLALLLILGLFLGWTGNVSARVCSAVPGEEKLYGCGGANKFEDFSYEKDYKDSCEKIEYDQEECGDGQITYKCPYDKQYVKCCDKSYHYDACIYPLESDGKCGGGTIYRYKCKCPDDYKITAEMATSQNCQPADYCTLNDGDTVTTKYKTCTCPQDVYTDQDSCKNNQTESSSCTDDSDKVYKKCYCDKTKYPYASCEYGKARGATSCTDSSTKREYYSACKTADEACADAGYDFSDCSSEHNCSTTIYNKTTGKYETLTSYNCIIGEACPYMPTSRFKCVFDKASWCTNNGYTQTSSVKQSDGATCSIDGMVGSIVSCPANDSSALYYYRCKITCDQRVLSKAGTSLAQDTRFGYKDDASGSSSFNGYWVYLSSPKNGFHAGYHLFLRGDFRMPDSGLAYDSKSSGDKVIYADSKSANKMYTSINGIGALYKLDPATYADCEDEYNNTSYNPNFKIPKNYANGILSRGLTNINIIFDDEDDTGTKQKWVGNKFSINREDGQSYTTWIWDNIGITHNKPSTITGGLENSHNVYFENNRTLISQQHNTKIRMTGKIKYDVVTKFVSDLFYPLSHAEEGNYQELGTLTFHGDGYHILEFKDATVSIDGAYGGPDIDARDEDINTGVLNIENSTVIANNIFSSINVNVNNNSTLRANAIHVDPHRDNYGRGGSTYNVGKQYCIGIAVRNNSKLYVTEDILEIHDGYLYVSGGSSVISTKPIRLNIKAQTVACIGDASSSITAYETTYNISNGDYTKNWLMPPKDLNSNDSTGRIVYSTADNSCIPYTVNKTYDPNSVYSKHCVGAYQASVNFMNENSWSGDQTTHATPAIIQFGGIKRGTDISKYSSTPTTTIYSWYPRKSTGNTAYSCKDDGKNYESKTGDLCSSSGDYKYSAFVGSEVLYYHYRGNCSNKCYGCSKKHQFICSGCSRCSNGVAYSDWSDTTGGL